MKKTYWIVFIVCMCLLCLTTPALAADSIPLDSTASGNVDTTTLDNTEPSDNAEDQNINENMQQNAVQMNSSEKTTADVEKNNVKNNNQKTSSNKVDSLQNTPADSWSGDFAATLDGTTLTISGTGDVYGPFPYDNPGMIRKIVIKEGITRIQNGFFSGCINLRSVYLPKSLILIEGTPFSNMQNLHIYGEKGSVAEQWAKEHGVVFEEKVTKDNKLNAVADYGVVRSVSECGPNITGTLYESGLMVYSGYGEMQHPTYFGNIDLIKEIIVEEGIDSIPTYAFSNCSNLKKVTFNNSKIKIIPNGTFKNCGVLEEVILPVSLSKIEKDVFSGTKRVKVRIPKNVYYIDSRAFRGTNQIFIYVDPSSYAEKYCKENGLSYISSVSGNNQSSVNLVIDSMDVTGKAPITLKAVDNNGNAVNNVHWSNETPSIIQIKQTNNLNEITVTGEKNGIGRINVVANGITFIVSLDSFVTPTGQCGQSTRWDLNDGVLEISGEGNVEYCGWRQNSISNQIKSVVIGSGIKELCDYAFSNCFNLKKITIAEGVTTIGREAFAGCHSLKYISFPSSVVSIGEGICQENESLEKVEFLGKVDNIPKKAFFYCGFLKYAIFSSPIIEIGESAFEHCYQLEESVFDTEIKIIGKRAFKDAHFVDVIFKEGLTTIEEEAFYSDITMCYVIFPKTLQKIGHYAFCEDNYMKATFLGNRLNEVTENGITYNTKIWGPHDGNVIAYYPSDNSTWNNTNMPSLGLFIEWHPIDANSEITDLRFVGVGDYLELVAGERRQLQVLSPPNKVNPNGIRWSSTDTSVLEVNNKGEIFAKKRGYAKIVVSTTDGKYTSECTVAVKHKNDNLCGFWNDPIANYEYLIYWHYDPIQSVLTIQGKDSMGGDYSEYDSRKPDCFYEAKTVIFEDGIKKIGYNVIASNKLENLIIADSVTEMHQNAISSSSVKYIDTGNGIQNTEGFGISNSKLELVNLGSGIKTISRYTFSGCENLSQIQLPLSLVQIEDYAFQGCTGLKEIKLPDSVTTVGNYAFTDCTALASISLGNGLKKISEGLFLGCSGLTVLPDLRNISTIGDEAFAKCNALKVIQLSDPSISWGRGAFAECINLENIVFGSQFTTISDQMFKGCTSIKNVVLPSSLKVIGTSAFEGDTGVLMVKFPVDGSNINVGNNAFYKCTGLRDLELTGAINRLGDCCFYGTSIEEIRIPVGIKEYGTDIFSDSLSNPMIVISDGVTTLPERLFYGVNPRCIDTGNTLTQIPDFWYMTELKTLILGDSIQIDTTFENCKKLKKVVLSPNIKDIPDRMFYNCSSLDDLTWGNIESIGVYAFYGCAFKNVVIPDSVGYVGSDAYTGCNKLESIVIGDGLTRMPVFENHPVLKYVSIGDSITDIKANCFKNCKLLETVILGDGVNNIGASAFEGCIHLKNVQLNNVITINSAAFKECRGFTSLLIPESVKNIGYCAFQNCSNVTNAVIKGAPNVGENAFAGCVGLRTLDTGESTGITNGFTLTEYKNLVTFKTNYDIPSGAFSGHANIQNVQLKEGIDSIGDNAFAKCTNLTNINIDNSRLSIGSSAFEGCNKLILNKITAQRIYSNAFKGCTQLNLKEVNVDYIYDHALSGITSDRIIITCQNIEKLEGCNVNVLVITAGEVNNMTFENFTGQEIILGPEAYVADVVTTNYKFNEMPNLKRITLGMRDMPIDIFYNCKSLETIIFEPGVEKLRCDLQPLQNLKLVVIPSTATIQEYFRLPQNCMVMGRYKPIDLPSSRFIFLMDGDVPGRTSTVLSMRKPGLKPEDKQQTTPYNAYVGVWDVGPLVITSPSGTSKIPRHIKIDDPSMVEIREGVVGPYYELKGLKPGSTTITIYNDDGAYSTRDIFVSGNRDATEGFLLTNYVKEMEPNKKVTIEVSVLLDPQNTEKPTISVLSSNQDVIKVTSIKEDTTTSGKFYVELYGNSLGSSDITVVANNGGVNTETIQVKYPDIDPSDNNNNYIPAFKGMLCIGESIEAGVAVGGKPLPENVKWTLSQKDIVYLTKNNYLVGLKPGKVTVTGEFRTSSGYQRVSKDITVLSRSKKSGFVEDKAKFIYGKNDKYAEKEKYVAFVYVPDKFGGNRGIVSFATERGDVKLAKSWSGYHQRIETDQFSLKPNEAAVFEFKVNVKDCKPESDCSELNFKLIATQEGTQISSTDITILNEKYVKPEPPKPTEPTEALKVAQYERVSLANTITLDANFMSYIGPEQEKLLKDLLITWVAMVGNDMFPDDVQNKVWRKFLKVPDLLGSTTDSSLVIEVETIDAGRRKVEFSVRLDGFRYDDKPLGSLGVISWKMLDSKDLEKQKRVISGTNGVSTYAYHKNFFDAVSNYAMEKVKKFYNTTWGDLANDLAADVLGETYAEVSGFLNYKFADGVFNLTAKPYAKYLKKTHVACPVDVVVYDEKGKIVGKVVNNVVDAKCTKIPMWVVDDQKHFVLADQDYTVELTGTSQGTMNYSVEEYEAGGSVSRKVEYNGLPLEVNKTYIGMVPEQMNVTPEAYDLLTDSGNFVKYDKDISLGVLLGDADGNGVVNIMDAMKVVQHIQGSITVPNTKQADMDENGVINIMDAMLIMHKIQNKTI